MANNEPDIIEQIDEVTEPGPDAATWSSHADTDDLDWGAPEAGKMYAVLLGYEGGSLVEIDCAHPGDDITALVGDPVAERMQLVPGLTFWVGDNSLTNAANPGASRFLEDLLRDASTGDYAVSDTDRDNITELLASPDWAPIVHGPCLVTGTDDSDDGPGPLNDTFRHWLTRHIQNANYLQEQEVVGVCQELAALGLLGVVAVNVNTGTSIAIVRP